MLSGSTRDQQEKDINYCSKARAGLARQEAVDERRYLSRVSFMKRKMCCIIFQKRVINNIIFPNHKFLNLVAKNCLIKPSISNNKGFVSQ